MLARTSGAFGVASAAWLLILIACLAGDLWSQRPAGTTAPPPRPPPSTAGHATARQRQIEAGAQQRSEEIRQGRSRRESEPEPDPDDPAPRKRLRPVDRAKERAFLDSLEARVRRVRTLSMESSVQVLGGPAGGKRLVVGYDGWLDRTGMLRHRVALMEIREGAEAIRDVFLLHEFRGERSQAWHLGRDGKPEPYVGNVLLHAPIPEVPLLFEDLLPFEPTRYDLTHAGEGERDGKPVAYVTARSRVGRPQDLRLVFHRYNRLVSRASAFAGGREIWRAAYSDNKTRDGLLAPERIRIEYPGRDASVVIRVLDRRINRKSDPTLFDPATFVR